MNNPWPKVKLSEVITHRKEFVYIDDFSTYKRCRLQLHAKGIVLRDLVIGSELKTKEQQICRSGDFLVAEIDAKVGGYGIVSDELDGAIVSSHYFLFEVNQDRIDHNFLGYFVRTPDFFDQVSARGTTNYAAIRPSHVLDYQIPLPPLREQQRIVAKIDELAAKIEEARYLRHQATEEAEALTHSFINQILTKAANIASWEYGPIPMFANVNPSRTGQFDLTPEDPVSFVPMKAVDDVTGKISWPEVRPFREVAKGYTWFKEGDVIFARITPCMQNGKAAIARNLVSGNGFGSTEFHVIRPGPKLLAEWLHSLVRHKAFREDASKTFKGTAGQQRVPQSFLDQRVIPVPPLAEQRQIIAEIDALRGKVDELKRMQAATLAELNSFLPSTLDKAFKGEL
jgi:type I restriction enzyme S subunit